MEELLISIILFSGIVLTAKLIFKLTDTRIRLNDRNAFLFLLSVILFGFITWLDNSDTWGCVVDYKPLSPNSIFNSLLSFGLIFIAFKSSNQNLKKILCLSESIIWILKLFIFKGGYVVGFGGTPDILVVLYDIIAITARLVLISILFEIIHFRIAKIAFIALTIMGIKVSTFDTPINMIYEEKRNLKAAQQKITELEGVWKGEVELIRIIEKESDSKLDSSLIDGKFVFYPEIEYDTISKKGLETIRIDKNFIYFRNSLELDRKFRLELFTEEFGYLNSEINSKSYEIWFPEKENDSLIFRLSNYSENFYFNLARVNQ